MERKLLASGTWRADALTCALTAAAAIAALAALTAAAVATASAASAAPGGVVPTEEPAVSRDDEPVVITGEGLSALIGTPVDHLGVFRFDPSSQAFLPIPFQVDERLDVTFTVGGQGEFVEEDMYDVLGLDDGLLDEQDEVVFLFGDGGAQAPTGAAWPANATSIRYETMVQDERSGQQPVTRWAYLFAGPALQRSPVGYVAWGGSPSSSIVTSRFSLDFTDRWLLTGFRVTPPCGSGADLTDRLKIRSAPLGLPSVDEEVLNLNSEFLGGLVGPIRVVRSVRGAKSGINTIHYDLVSRGRWTRLVHLRVHPLDRFDVYFDWLPRSNALFFRDGMAGPVPINGVPDPSVSTSFAAWNLVRGPGGGMFVVYDAPPSPFFSERRLYYRDDAGYNDAPAGTGHYPDEDDSAYGTHGLSILNVQECNFERVDVGFRVEPLCSAEGSLDLALAHFELVTDPLEVEATPQSAALGTVRGLTVARDGSDVVLSWPPAGGAASYRVYSTLSMNFPFASWTLQEEVPGTAYRDAGEAVRTGTKAYSIVAVGPDGTEGLW